MNAPKNMESVQDEEYQLTFLLDRPMPNRSPVPPEVAEHVLHLTPAADEPDSRT